MDDIMDTAARMVEFLGIACGETCEIVLQDLRPGKMRIVAIANGHISGRSVGAPLTDLALKLIAQGVWKTRDHICNYEGKTRDNRILHSSTFFIKNEGKLWGMLSVNVDVSQYIRISNDILRLAGLNSISQISAIGSQTENFYDNMEEIIKSVFTELKTEDSVERLSQADRLVVIERLMDRGIFLLRGSVSCVAQKLQCSEASLYRYISMITKKRGKNYVGTGSGPGTKNP
jgi:predicted transcriptional regulator YheO